jgi:hypothetical protein
VSHIASYTKVQNAGATAVSVTVTAAVVAGHTLFGAICWESTAGTVPTITSITDSRGNTWTTTPDVSVNAGTTLALAIIRARVTTALQAGDTITITISASRSRWAIQVDEFDDVNTAPLDKTASNAPGSAAALSSGVTAATTQAYELDYVALGFGTGRTVTIPSGWSGGAQVATSAGSTDRALQVIWRYTSGAGTQEGTLALSSASTYGGVIGTYKATSLLPPVARVSQVKLQTPPPGVPAVARVSQVRLQVPPGVIGVARVAQVRLQVPALPGQAPYSGLKAITSDGKLINATISSVEEA